MHTSSPFESHSPSPAGSTTTRAVTGLDDTAQPPLTSGFGSVMEREQDIRSSTTERLGVDNGPKSAAIDRILRHQQLQLGANIALLEQRYEMLPHPTRFATLPATHGRLSHARGAAVAPDAASLLPNLVAQHISLLRAIEALITQRPDGQRGELILTEIARNHEEMAWMLTALINEDDSVRDLVPIPVTASLPAAPKAEASEADWENEGGASPGR